MKKYKYIIPFPVLLATILMVSCNKELDIKPEQSILTETALSNSQYIERLLTGAYTNMRADDLWGGRFNEFSELYAATTDLSFIGSFSQPEEFIEKDVIADNIYLRDTWIQAYYLNNIVNTILYKLDVVDDDIKDRIEGEAKLMRGWLYFELVRFWGQPYDYTTPSNNNTNLGVPIILTPTLVVEDVEEVTRNTVAECYAQAIQDLTDAKTLLGPSGQNGTNLSTYVASAVLSRIYLQQANYTLAAQEASRVIEEGGYKLVENPRKAFNNASNTGEDIFAFQQNTVSNEPRLAVMYASLSGIGRGDYEVSPNFFELFENGDLRGSYQPSELMENNYTDANVDSMYYYGVGSINNYGGINTIKWGNYYTNLPMIRLAEMYLTRAEANFEEGSSIGATPLEDINTIRSRANAPDLGSVDRDLIRLERYKELCWEGFRLHDLKRWHIDIGSIPYDSWDVILPIPLRELEANPNLEPNPGQLTN